MRGVIVALGLMAVVLSWAVFIASLIYKPDSLSNDSQDALNILFFLGAVSATYWWFDLCADVMRAYDRDHP